MTGQYKTSSFRDGPKDQTSDAQLRIGESRDSGFASSMRPGMTDSIYASRKRNSGIPKRSAYSVPPLPLRERSDCIGDAIRVRGYGPSIDRNPSPQPSPAGGEGAHC